MDARERPTVGSDASERYRLRAALGSGGMGEVRLCRDERIGRDVALKVIRPSLGARVDAVQRFLREGRVQAQLEHPAIVPVYDLGEGPTGEAYFTMKRVRGASLDEVIDRLVDGDEEARARWTRRRLLEAFARVCLAVDYAHERGVVHRDLKPANLMLGDWGEVYVLDWGLAKIAGADDFAQVASAGDGAGETDAVAPVEVRDGSAPTAAGAILGTPGYMPPEQIRGLPLDRRADVYALGAVLFELLTLEHLHRGGNPAALIAATLLGADARASERAPGADVPPELEALCVQATDVDPEKRPATARALAEAVERYLDGDRDLALRRALAADHARRAEAEAERALVEGDATAAETAREQAMGEVGRALALDPNSREAMCAMVTLLDSPPRHVPTEVEDGLERRRASYLRMSARGDTVMVLATLAMLPMLVAMGIRDWLPMAAFVGLLVASGLASWGAARTNSRALMGTAASTHAFGALMLYPVAGAYVIVPAVLAVAIVSRALAPTPGLRRINALAGFASFILLVVVAQAGILPAMYSFEGDGMRILSRAVGLPGLPTEILLFWASLLPLLVAVVRIGPLRAAYDDAERRLEMQAWHLRRLAPPDARPGGTE